jgi:tetratricopeptide (TPR) repeat protein
MSAPSLRSRRLLGLREEVAAQVDVARQKLSKGGVSADTFGESALQAVAQTALDSASYSAIKRLLQRQLKSAEEWRGILRIFLQEVQASEARHIRRELYGPGWWDARRAELRREFDQQPDTAVEHWLQTFAELLLAWEWEVCDELVNEVPAIPAALGDVPLLFRQGVAALRSKRYPAALPMLMQIAQSQPNGPLKGQLPSPSRALLYTLIGRIHLNSVSDPDAACRWFDQACQLDPDDGRPDAALGEYHLVRSDNDQALASFQQALLKSPNQPDGYLGMGWYFERQSIWDDAAEWYDKAIAVVWEEKDVLKALRKGLAPVSGKAWLCLARALLSDEPGHALEAVQYTLDEHLLGERGEGEAYELRGDILRTLGRPVEAAQAYCDAGHSYYWTSDYVAAVRVLKSADELKSNDPDLYWHWADSLRNQSSLELAPYVDEAKISESLHVWELGYAKGRPGADSSWGYTCRALISEQLARVGSEGARAHWWEAVVYLERAILLWDQDPIRWTGLCRVHRLLGNYASAFQAMRATVDLDGQSAAVIEEQAAILVDTGRFEAALEVIEKLPSEEMSPWLIGIKALAMCYRGDQQAALDLINMSPTTASDLWSRDLRASCYLKLGSVKAACEDYDWIWRQRESPAYAADLNTQDTFGAAAYHLAVFADRPQLLADAIGIYLRLRTLPGQNVRGPLGVCYLARQDASDIESAEQLFNEVIERTTNLRELAALLHFQFATIREHISRWRNAAAVGEVVERARLKAIARSEILLRLQPQSPEAERAHAAEELRRVLADLVPLEAAGGCAEIGALSGLARLRASTEQTLEAAGIYQQLQRSELERFPEAYLGVAACIDVLQAGADRLVADGQPAEAERRLLQIATLVREALSNDLPRQAAFSCRLACVRLELGNPMDARENFAAALRSYRAAGVSDAGASLGVTCRSLLHGIESYWTLDANWCAWREEPQAGEHRNELIAAGRELAGYLDEVLQLAEQPNDSRSSLVTPIVLEIGPLFIPSDTGPEWTLFKTLIPEMKQRIADQLGLALPGVRVRPIAGEQDSYSILLDEIPVTGGRVDPGSRYCTSAPAVLNEIGIESSALVPTDHPVTGAPGAWVRPEHWDLIEKHHLELWTEPLQFIVQHLESVLRQHPADFVGIQEVENMLTEWSTTEVGQLLVQTSLSDEPARWRFARVLRSLAKDGIPLMPWEPVMRAAAAAGIHSAPMSDIMRTVRMKLQNRLPGNVPPVTYVELVPERDEEKLLNLVRGGSASISPQQALELLATLRDRVDSNDRHTILVTRPELRVVIRRLVEEEFPYLRVMARDELLVSGVAEGAAARA